MTRYSHTRLSQFDNCRYAYDLRYNRGVESPYETIEAFTGKVVHEALASLYNDLQDDVLRSKEEILETYRGIWDSAYHGCMINNTDWSDDDWMDMGAGWISAYYDRKHPFDDMHIAGIETDDLLELPDGNTYSVRIDRFGFKDGVFYVCDYKTGGRRMSQWAADTDRQLAMYAVWVKQRYGQEKRVKLVWHMLRFNEDVESERSYFELQDQVNRVVGKIREIEACDDWSPNEGRLCDWCVYRHMCPLFEDEYRSGE